MFTLNALKATLDKSCKKKSEKKNPNCEILTVLTVKNRTLKTELKNINLFIKYFKSALLWDFSSELWIYISITI